ncbi:hypothetical protein CVD28_04130 [Bacillus sp. M6-12]|uniref:hypothetical protein n=1 Tax=Bacillus sp. M6-12 TaxID=2054166 RepID=UPI000C7585CA|nr:hypothetical protein [Bacillus sp. M6-12]PLS19613.1 hypothetical protein CVD28_04130 [Bacillus sp. M6-12]
MFIWTSIIGIIFFLVSFIAIFKVRQHPYTIVAYSGSMASAIVLTELIGLIQFKWVSLIVIPVFLFVAWFSYSLFKKIGKGTAKEIILKSLIPTLLILLYAFVINIWFVFPMFIMSLFVPILTPKHIKEQRRNLFVS